MPKQVAQGTGVRRFMNKDGSLRVQRVGERRPISADLYHTLLSISWPRFLALVVCVYVCLNSVFALAYFACGPGALMGANEATTWDRLMACFFFSVQTFATIGYGHISPQGVLPNVIVTFEAMAGLLEVAVATGIVFSRFSRPTARVVFSHVALITKVDGERCFMFRMANERLNQIVDARVTLTLLKTETTAEGATYRNLYDLKLERDHSSFFSLSWTVVHPITPDSPLYNMSLEEMEKDEIAIAASVIGMDETFSQTVHARYTYAPNEIVFDRYYRNVLGRSDYGITLNLANLSLVQEQPE